MSQSEFYKYVGGLSRTHPLFVFFEENDYIKKLIEVFESANINSDREHFLNVFNQLSNVEKRYTRKENQLFPYLEKYGWFGPGQGMWSFHDHIRDIFRHIRTLFDTIDENREQISEYQNILCSELNRMIAVEEGHLLPYANTLLKEDDWASIEKGDSEIGWAHKEKADTQEEHFFSSLNNDLSNNFVNLEVGKLNFEQINLLFKFMPFDVTLVDENDRVVFYNRGEERVFPRSPGVIGREVRFCHPPKSLDKVLRIVKEFKNGTRDVAEFWIRYREKVIHIRYFAIRDRENCYKGVLEISQDITEIQKLTGEQRLLNWD